MGQIIMLPKERQRSKLALTDDRRHAIVTALSVMVFLLGFFIVGPTLAVYAFGYVTMSNLGSAGACIGGLLVTWAVTRWAYKHL